MQENQRDERGDIDQAADGQEKNDRADDQTKRSYYYDDAHGYETFYPEEPTEEAKGQDQAAS